MQIEEGYLYHIYNQGNNRQRIFFERRNYDFFLRKMRTHLLPHCDVLAYCLMPNHFHWMVRASATRSATQSRAPSGPQSRAPSCPQSRAPSGPSAPSDASNGLQKSIGILLASYTRAINKQENRTGSLFRCRTKAVCLNCSKGIEPSYFNTAFGAMMNVSYPDKEYLQVCFDYIHLNPVNANLVKSICDWEFSSAKAYYRNQEDGIVNKTVASEYVVYSGRDLESQSE